jgi:enamine deaminase RidA (YjgF/YER057c/UK114 family)
MSFEARIKELGLPLPGPPRPAGRFVPAVQTGNLIFVSGQISVVSGQPGMKGKLGKDLSIEQGQEIVEVQS